MQPKTLSSRLNRRQRHVDVGAQMRRLRQSQWHLDEIHVKVTGEMRYLWRVADHEGELLYGALLNHDDQRPKFSKRRFVHISSDNANQSLVEQLD